MENCIAGWTYREKVEVEYGEDWVVPFLQPDGSLASKLDSDNVLVDLGAVRVHSAASLHQFHLHCDFFAIDRGDLIQLFLSFFSLEVGQKPLGGLRHVDQEEDLRECESSQTERHLEEGTTCEGDCVGGSDLPQEDRDEKGLSDQGVEGEPFDRFEDSPVESHDLRQVEIGDLEEAVPAKMDGPNSEQELVKLFRDGDEISQTHGELTHQHGRLSPVLGGDEADDPRADETSWGSVRIVLEDI